MTGWVPKFATRTHTEIAELVKQVESAPEFARGGVVYELDPDHEAQEREARERWDAAMQPGTPVYNREGNRLGTLGEAERTDDGWTGTLIGGDA